MPEKEKEKMRLQKWLRSCLRRKQTLSRISAVFKHVDIMHVCSGWLQRVAVAEGWVGVQGQVRQEERVAWQLKGCATDRWSWCCWVTKVSASPHSLCALSVESSMSTMKPPLEVSIYIYSAALTTVIMALSTKEVLSLCFFRLELRCYDVKLSETGLWSL